jgi:hypothetical protein
MRKLGKLSEWKVSKKSMISHKTCISNSQVRQLVTTMDEEMRIVFQNLGQG